MLVEDQRGLMRLLANALLDADEGIVCCERCGGITERHANPCRICTGERAEGHVLCSRIAEVIFSRLKAPVALRDAIML